MRQLAEPPKAKASAASRAPAGCQPRSRKYSINARPPVASIANTTPSSSRNDGSGEAQAARRKNGEKISDCGSEICGMPAKTLGVQKGDWPECNACAKKANCGWKCALASQGMV